MKIPKMELAIKGLRNATLLRPRALLLRSGTRSALTLRAGRMRLVILAVLAFVAGSALDLEAQNLCTVTASNIQQSGSPLSAGTIYFQATDANARPISFQLGGGGQVVTSPYFTAITNGAIGTFTVANPANTIPANIRYTITIQNTAGGNILTYTNVKIASCPFNFDTYVSGANLPYGTSADILTIGKLIVTGSCSYSGITGCGGGGGGGGTLTTLNGLTAAVQDFTKLDDTNVTITIDSSVSPHHKFTIGWTGSLAKGRQHSATVYNDQANTFGAGFKQIFTPSATTAGLNHAGVTADPSSLAAGDLWFRSDLGHLKWRDNASTTHTLFNSDDTLPFSQVSGTGNIPNIAPSADNVIGSTNGSSFSNFALVNCGDSSHAIAYSTTTHTFSCQSITGSAAAGGSNTQVQYNNAGGLSGISTFTSDGTVNSAKVGTNWNFIDPTTTTKKFQFDASNISAATTRTVNVPDANSTLAQAKAQVARQWLNSMSSQGVFASSQPATTDLSDYATSAPSADGQIPIWNASAGQYQPGDPITSKNVATLLSAVAATATANGTKRLSTLSTFGTLYVTYASITGSPSGCTIQLANVDILGNSINNGSAISTTPSNGTTSFAVSPAAALQTSDQIKATYACSVYPSAGTVTIVFSPGESVGLMNALPTGSNTIGNVGLNAGSNTIGKTDQGAANTVANAWPAKVTDGTNTAAVKAASTAAAATDPALVVAISPNNTVGITASSLPLPSNAAQETGGNLATIASAVRAEDTVSADADKGIGALAIRKATPANTSNADGDYEYLQMSNGRLWTSSTIDSALPTGSNTIGKVDQGAANATPWNENIAQFGGTNLATGTGASGAGIPRVTVSNDSSVVVRGGQKGTTNTNADVTHTPSGANHELMDMAIYDASGNQITSFGGGTQYAEGTTQATATGTVAMAKDASNVVHPVQVDGSNNLKINCVTGCSASSGSNFGTPSYVQPPESTTTGAAGKPGRAAQYSILSGIQYSANPPVLKPGEQVPIQSNRFGEILMAPPRFLPPIKLTIDGQSTVGSPTNPLYTATVPATMPASYMASTGATGFTAASSATDIFTITGSSTSGVAIMVTRIVATCTQTTAGIIGIQVLRRSTADTAGTNVTEAIDDSKFGASGATVAQYTANPTLGTQLGGPVDGQQVGCMAPGTASANDAYILDRTQKPIILRGANEQLAVNLNGVTVTGNKFTITVYYMAVVGI
jgi:hypothetical protein